jgi:hypothetical protein
MNAHLKTQFKTWQRLPELAGARPVAGRSGWPTVGVPETGPDHRLTEHCQLEAAARRDEGARSQKLKFIVTTHD